MAELLNLSKIDLIAIILESRCQICKRNLYEYDEAKLKPKPQPIRFFGCLPKSPTRPPPDNKIHTSPIDIKRRIHPLPQ